MFKTVATFVLDHLWMWSEWLDPSASTSAPKALQLWCEQLGHMVKPANSILHLDHTINSECKQLTTSYSPISHNIKTWENLVFSQSLKCYSLSCSISWHLWEWNQAQSTTQRLGVSTANIPVPDTPGHSHMFIHFLSTLCSFCDMRRTDSVIGRKSWCHGWSVCFSYKRVILQNS